MDSIAEKAAEIEKKIIMIKLMIEKRKERVKYYQKLVCMHVAESDRQRLECNIFLKEKEVRSLTDELGWLDIQKSFYEVKV